MAEPTATLPDLPERYRALEWIGEGATGEVFKAADLLLGRVVAIKVVRANLALHSPVRVRFAREVALSAQMVHPHVVPVYDQGTLADGRPFVTMGYADRGNLADRLNQGLPLVEAVQIIDQILAALGALHARGVLHQDLKPANVLLHGGAGGRSHAWIADLGAAGALSELAMDRRGITGTPAWMAPEQLMGRAQELGPWTDLYPVGLMLKAVLGHGPPIDDIGRQRLLEERMLGLGPLGDKVPEALAQVIENLLDPDPRQRYDRAADARRALRAATRSLFDPAFVPPVVTGVRDTSTTFGDDVLPELRTAFSPREGAVSSDGTVPRWNRVPPDPLPEHPPAEVGLRAANRSNLALFALREPPLVAGRSLRRRLWEHARAVLTDHKPRVVLVVGAEGSGKSRVVASVAEALDEGGFMEQVTLRYHFPAGVEDGYRGAVRELLVPWNDTRFEAHERLMRWLARDWQVPLDRVRDEAAALTRWCGFLRPGETPVNAALGLAYLYRYLEARSWRGGACVVIEDVHHARGPGEGLAICEALLGGTVGERPVLVMVTVSAEALEHDSALRARMDSLVDHGAVRLEAPRLNTAELRRLLADGLLLVPELAERLAPRCDGSPTFATLLVRDWATRGMLVQREGLRFDLKPGYDLEDALPSDMAELCQRRIAGALATAPAPEAASRALAASALAGQEPPALVVRQVEPEGLDALLATGLLRQRGWRLVFEHGGIRRAARRAALTRRDVAQFHLELAEAWEQLGRNTGIDTDLPHGLHRLHGGQAERAVAPLLRATRTALAEGRYALALDAARLAGVAADRTGVRMARVEARQREVEALLELDRPAEARPALEAARRVGQLDRRTAAHLQVHEARLATAEGQLDKARQLLDAAAATFEATRDLEGLVATAHGQGALYQAEGRPIEAADRYKRMLKLGRGDERMQVLALTGLIQARIHAGRLRGILRLLDRVRRIARDSGDIRNIAQATYAGGLVHLSLGHLDDAERYFRTGRAVAATLGAGRLQLACENNLGEVYRYRGDARGAERCYGRAARFAEAHGWRSLAAVGRLNLALLALQRNAEVVAQVEAARAERLLQQHPRHWCWIFLAVYRALWAAEAGDEADCQAWWALANERGLDRMASPDLWLPLQRLARVAGGRGWSPVAERAAALARNLAVASAGVDIEE